MNTDREEEVGIRKGSKEREKFVGLTMFLGWRRSFCTSISRDQEPTVVKEKPERIKSSPRFGTKFGFLSNPSTPRLQSHSAPNPTFPRRTTSSPLPPNATVPASSTPAESPNLRCKTKTNSPRFFTRSTPSSPRSPSTFSFLHSSLRLSKGRCGICSQKTGQGMAIFTAECTHSFHFRCITAHVEKKDGLKTCPVCNSTWEEMPLLSNHRQREPNIEEQLRSPTNVARTKINDTKQSTRLILKVYNDDEPLMSPTSGARFNPIPESDETENEEIEYVSPVIEPVVNSRDIEVRLQSEAVVVSIGRSFETCAIILKLRAPPEPSKTVNRAPIDLVTVLDVSARMNTEKLQKMKRAMRLLVSCLSSSDRLSIVAFSAVSKRLLPLRRMTTAGRRSARRIVDSIVALDGTAIASDAVKKAAKVLEDRRERNSVASIIVFTDGHDDRATKAPIRRRQSSVVYSTRIAQLEIPVHSIELKETGADAFAKCVGGLLSVVVQDLKLQLGFASPAGITAVYSCTDRTVSHGSGSIRVGDLWAEEERKLLVELKVPSSAIRAHHVLSVRCSYKDPSTQQSVLGKEQTLLVPRQHAVRSSTPSIERLRNLFVSTRAIAEARKLVERSDLVGAQQMLSSALAFLLQSSSAPADELICDMEAELAELQLKRQNQMQQVQWTRTARTKRVVAYGDDKGDALTPISAWKAAERLAKLAIMRKSLNRVMDLHGFEDARF